MEAEQLSLDVISSSTGLVRLLVFPLDLDTAKDFVMKAKSLNLTVIGASSEMDDAIYIDVDDFIHLPYITSPEFNHCFKQAILKYNITHVYAPHSGVWIHINNLLASQTEQFDFHLCTPTPFEADWQEYQASYQWAEQEAFNYLAEQISPEEIVKPKLKTPQYAGLHKQFIRIPGQCNDDKLSSLAAVMRTLPEGDIVEIGSLYGRSAYALGYLAEKYALGNVVCIDPWDTKKIQHQGESAELLKKQIIEANTNNIFKIFLANAGLLNTIGYIRDISEAAVKIYEEAVSNSVLDSESLGSVNITGEISLLHIDGNHRYDHVCKDIETWVPKVKSGGWVLLDDYVWAFGDGPKKAGNELIKKEQFEQCFCFGDTLFIRKE